jgi:hypothetical protein
MIDDQFILKVERLRDAVEELRTQIRSNYARPTAQVASARIKEEARRIAEVWMVEVAIQGDVRMVLDPETIADYNIEFQRLLTYSERRSQRNMYDEAATNVLRDFRARVIVPLKQRRGREGLSAVPSAPSTKRPQPLSMIGSVFVAHSFAPEDRPVVDAVVRLFKAFDLEVQTGEKPKADLVSSKVRKRIEACDGFVGVFTRRDRLTGRGKWATSAWVIDEKAFALANDRKLILLKEKDVISIGGLQGDYEYLEFDRDNLADLVLLLLEMFRGAEE